MIREARRGRLRGEAMKWTPQFVPAAKVVVDGACS